MNSQRSALFVLPGLVLANLAVLLLSVVQKVAIGFPRIVIDWGLVPERLTQALFSGNLTAIGYNLLTFVSSTFLHAGFDHFLNNMALLLIMGILVERELGSERFLAIYLVSALAASFNHYLFHAFDYRPMVGASGAISGVMGAFLVVVFCMGQRITLLRMLGVLFVGNWVLDQVVSIYANSGARDGVAYFAHLGGFAGGLIISFWLVRRLMRSASKRETSIEPTSSKSNDLAQ